MRTSDTVTVTAPTTVDGAAAHRLVQRTAGVAPAVLTIDMSRTLAITADGLGALRAAARQPADRGTGMRFVGASGHVRFLLSLTLPASATAGQHRSTELAA